MKKIKSIISIILISVICLCCSSFAYAQSPAMRYENGAMTISGLDSTASLIHASYDDGVLVNIEITNVTNGTNNINAGNGDKFFLWKNISTMIPLCGIITVGENTDTTPETGKTLVVYFSASGTTERVANYIKNAADADIFELEPVNPYTSADLNYGNSSSRVVREHNNPDLQDIELASTTVPDWSSYDTVFIGYPIWWHSASWVAYNFVKDNDFTGKTVIPFSTSASSGEVGDDVIKTMTKTGSWRTGRGFYSSASESTVRDWVDSLNLK